MGVAVLCISVISLEKKMAALSNKLPSSFAMLFTRRHLSVATAFNAKAKNQEDPIKKLFLEKMSEFKSKGDVSPIILLDSP